MAPRHASRFAPQDIAAVAAVAATWALALAVLVSSHAQPAQAAWSRGQATFYPWIDEGSCGYENLTTGNYPTGRFIAAVSDQVQGYRDMCGKCFEVVCEPRLVRDAFQTVYYGAPFACKEPRKSIVVMVTDECTCAGNTKWCCNKALNHLDLSEEAYTALADISKSGAMAMKFRSVPCPGIAALDNRRKVKKNCQTMLYPWQQCGGTSTNIVANQKDAPWPGFCCPKYLTCVRNNFYFWWCKRPSPSQG